jgi:hypothetical protein
MTEWLSDWQAIKLICEVRKISEGFATQFLVSACAAGVRARQRPCYNLGDLGITIPAGVWRDAHFDLDTGVLYPAGTDPMKDDG